MGLPLGAYRAGPIVSGERRRSDRGRRRALDDAAGMGGENEPRTCPRDAPLSGCSSGGLARRFGVPLAIPDRVPENRPQADLMLVETRTRAAIGLVLACTSIVAAQGPAVFRTSTDV